MTLHIQVGQGGNQVGDCFQSSSNDKSSLIFAVDTEPKVVNSSLSSKRRRTFTQEAGRGNNFAMGYNHSSNKVFINSILEAVRTSYFESCPSVPEIVLWHSIAGGTGSGLTATIVEQLRDSYPKLNITSVSIAPFDTGETAVQSYNVMLSLHALQNNVDAIIYKPNSIVARQVEYYCKGQKQRNITLNQMNSVIAADVLGLCSTSSNHHLTFGNSVATNLCPCSTNKFLTVACSTSSFLKKKPEFSPPSLISVKHIDDLDPLKVLSKTVGAINVGHKKLSSFATSVAMTSHNNNNMMALNTKIKSLVNKSLPPVPWNVQAPTINYKNSKMMTSTSTTVAVNVAPHGLEKYLDDALLKFNAKAYLHYYDFYGIGNNEFNNAFNTCEDIIASYNSIN